MAVPPTPDRMLEVDGLEVTISNRKVEHRILRGISFSIATGEMHSVRDFLNAAGENLGMDWEKVVEIDPTYYRAAEVDALCGDAAKAREQLGWEPTVTFNELVKIMVDADVKQLADERAGLNIRAESE